MLRPIADMSGQRSAAGETRPQRDSPLGETMSLPNSRLALLLASSLLAPLPALAETPAPTQATSVEEVVISAEKTTENLQDVPIAVTAAPPRRWRPRVSTTSPRSATSRRTSPWT